MGNLALADFEPHLGESWEMEANGSSWPARLSQAEPLNDSGREGGSFRLEFVGPADPAFQQGIFTFRRGEDAHEIFVVASGRDENGTRYEAVFF